MEILKKIAARSDDLYGAKIPTIAFLGDSVTQGCFELYTKTDGSIETYFDPAHAYSRYVADALNLLFPRVSVNIVNAGISGDCAPGGLLRLERDVLSHRPDLTVVCYGLNDSAGGMDSLPGYARALDEIFTRLRAADSEIIFMTPNMMCTYISCHVLPSATEIAKKLSAVQNDGILTAFLEEAGKVAGIHGVPVCDVYAKWQQMAGAGVDITGLLANSLNHPTREMNRLFASSLLDTMLEN